MKATKKRKQESESEMEVEDQDQEEQDEIVNHPINQLLVKEIKKIIKKKIHYFYLRLFYSETFRNMVSIKGILIN